VSDYYKTNHKDTALVNQKTEYGILIYKTLNIGDEIQSVSAMQFLPQKPFAYFFRDHLDKFRPPEQCPDKIKLIMNGWWCERSEHFAPPEIIDPFLISMHLRPDITISPKMLAYFKKHGPVGCRDQFTRDRLQKIGIPSYFSGCLTLTLQKNPAIQRQDFILAVDISDDMLCFIAEKTERPIYTIKPVISPFFSPVQCLELAKAYLYLYQQAHCVVTSRLHAALPSLALETPVLLLRNPDPRFTGLTELLHYGTEQDFFNRKIDYNFDNPPVNSDGYVDLRKSLIQTCENFTGINCETSKIDIPNPLIYLLNALNKDRDGVEMILWRFKKKKLLKNIFIRLITNRKKYTIEW
jgi:hypothetical protein